MSNEQYMTTAATAEFEASTAKLAHEVELNAEKERHAAEQAAAAAKAKGAAFTGDSSLGDQLSKTTEAAVSQGKQDVDSAKATGQGYVEQAKGLAANAVSTAQAYLPVSLGGTTGPAASAGPANAMADAATGGVVETVKNVAATAYATGTQYAQQAQAALQPHVERAAQAANAVVNQATTKGALEDESVPASTTSPLKDPSAIPATSAPLETGGVTTGSMYPSTTVTAKTNAL